MKNAYVGRTFIQPSQTIRQLGIRLKLNPLKNVIKGKRLVVVDDSIVRGNTQRALVRMLREAGAAEIHVRISSAPVTWPCFYGIDFASRAELIASGLGVEEIRASIGADSLGYISLDGMVEATEQKRERLCTACFTGEYPIELPDSEHLASTPWSSSRSSLSAWRSRSATARRRATATPKVSPPAWPAAPSTRSPVPDERQPPSSGVDRSSRPRDGDDDGPSAVEPSKVIIVASAEPGTTALTYASAGVDTEAGDRAVELMKASVRRTHGPEVLGGLGASPACTTQVS